MDQVATHGWDAYRVVFITIAVALAVPVFLHFLTRVVGVRHLGDGAAAEAPPHEVNVPVGRSINTRYFSAAQQAAILGLPLMLLVPLAAAGGRSHALAVLSVSVFSGAALVYANRKGDLRWHEKVSPEEGQASENSSGEARG